MTAYDSRQREEARQHALAPRRGGCLFTVRQGLAVRMNAEFRFPDMITTEILAEQSGAEHIAH